MSEFPNCGRGFRRGEENRLDTIVGTVEHITYRNEESGYTVARLESGDSASPVTVTGMFPFINPGETLRILGEWTFHPQYGRQFKMTSYQQVTPATLNGIRKYLGSGLIKGIGPVTAEKLVNYFGHEVLDVIEKHPERLTEVEGIGPAKAGRITDAVKKQREIQEVMVFLQGYGVNPALANRIYKAYGMDSIRIVRENPYRLADEVFGVGFKSADKIALALGWKKDCELRVRSGLRYVLGQASNEGHTYLPVEKLTEEAVRLLEVDSAQVQDAISEETGRSLHIEKWREEERVYLRPLYFAEMGTAERLRDCVYSFRAPLFEEDVFNEIRQIESEMGITLARNQVEAVKAAWGSGVCVITGGPGTGKTTILQAIVRLFERKGLSVALAAPTGRAAKRLTEAVGVQAKTIHRLLEYSFGDEGMGFGRDRESPLPADVVVIDEVSMLDVVLANNLLKAIRPGSRMVLVGDADQLPSVGPGTVLSDVIRSGTVKVIRLDEVFRQAQKSLIVVNAHRINRGIPPVFSNEGDFFFIKETDLDKMNETLIDLVVRRLPSYLKCDPIADIQVLTPTKRGPLGTFALNQSLQQILNPKLESGIRLGSSVFAPGDKVMQIRNNYQKDVYNGDVGVVDCVDREERQLWVRYPDTDGDRRILYDAAELDELMLAYAVSVHKSQGSEYPAVVMPISWIMPALMTRNLLYTAVTRARKMVVLVGDKRALSAYIRNTTAQARYSGLYDLLRERFGLA